MDIELLSTRLKRGEQRYSLKNSEWKESEHPRGEDGKFGTGGLTVKQKTYDSENVEASTIIPMHEVRDQKKYDKIKESMSKNGWEGRPILVIDQGETSQAMTGSHRVAAAQDLGIDIPVVKIKETDIEKLADDIGLEGQDKQYYMEDVFSKLSEGSDEDKADYLRSIGLAEKADLMDEEVDKNYDDPMDNSFKKIKVYRANPKR
jgi:hypothetical protein